MFQLVSRLRKPGLRMALAGLVAIAVPVLVFAPQPAAVADKDRARPHVVTIPEEDRFTPMALTIHAGDTVKWVNNDTDDHTVVSDDVFNTTGPHGVNHLIPGTDNNNGQPGTFTIHFNRPGTFVYYCRFHSHLDDQHQPVAPGPDGGIQDSNGNFGTPMMGVITVLPGD
jgi:plastocyanin